jgi:cadmium resistance protein CadD (predicted permease)
MTAMAYASEGSFPRKHRRFPLTMANVFTVLIEATGIAAVAAVSYLSTNFDNLAVLSAYSAKPGVRPLYVRLVFVAVCVVVLAVSLALALAAGALLSSALRYLGLIPLCLGLFYFYQGVFGQTEEPSEGVGAAMGPSAYLGLAAVLLANSTDSVSVMTPLLADLKPLFVLVTEIAALLVAIAMSLLAQALGHHPVLRIYVERTMRWILPFLLIAIGLLILTSSSNEVFAAT